jgi:Flp pilus assembly protein TadD
MVPGDAASPDMFDFPGKGNREMWVKSVIIYNEGIDLLNTGQIEKAINEFNKAISIYSDDAHYFCELGVALENTQRYSASEAAYQKAIALDPGNWQYWSN